MWCVVPAPISAASSTGSRERQRRVVVEEPRVEHPDCRSRRRRAGRALAGIEPQPQAVRILLLAFGGRPSASRGRSTRASRGRAGPARPRPLEERDQRSRRAGLVTEVEVVAVRVVEVDGLLDEREAERVAVEVESSAARRSTRTSRGGAPPAPSAVVYAEQAEEHDRVREEQHRDDDRQPRQVALDDVRPALRGRA